MSGYIDDVKQNYEELHASTGESFESIANRVEANGDRNLAAYLRSRAAGEQPAGTDPAASAPVGRQAGNGSLKTAGAGDDAAAAAAAQAEADAAAAKAQADADAAAAAAAAEAEAGKAAKADAAAAKK